MFVQRDIWDAFMARFVAAAAELRTGDPMDPETVLGPMVEVAQAQRAQRWVEEGVAMGGKLLTGGRADGAFFPPTVMTDVPVTAQICSNEAFAPVVVAFPFDDFEDAIGQVNDSFYGLQTGVFTNEIGRAHV